MAGRKVAVVLVTAAVAWLLGATLHRYDGEDFADARHAYEAEVVSCDRHGPVSLRGGFGFWYECAVRTERYGTDTVKQPGFFTSDETGERIVIGENGFHRGRYEWSRRELPDRPLLSGLGYLLAFVPVLIAGLVAVLLLLVLRAAITELPRAAWRWIRRALRRVDRRPGGGV